MKNSIKIAAILSFITVACAHAQTVDAQSHYKEATLAGINNIRTLVRPVLSPEELEVEKAVDVEVVAEGSGINAFASKGTHGRLKTTVMVGLPEVLEFMAISYVWDDTAKFSGCGDEYSRYLMERVVENSIRVANGTGHLRPVISVSAYGHVNPGSCRGIPYQFANAQQDLRFRKIMGASIAFLYLHELAHHIHKDYDLAQASNEVKRIQEESADSWAISTGAKLHWELAAALPIMVFIQGTGGTSLEDENKSDHPLGTKRFLNALLQTRPLLQQWHASQSDLEALDAAIERCKQLQPE